MSDITSIGKVIKHGQQISVTIQSDYRKAMKHMEEFSHIHLIAVSRTNKLSVITGQVQSLDTLNGEICLKACIDELRIKKEEFPLDLVDIKPYMPSEDYAVTDDYGGKNTGIEVYRDTDGMKYEANYVGEIRNTHGITYLQYNDESDIPKVVGEYVHVIWWFDKFEENKYRRILQCDPPYESDGRTGVFACRAPVRPNPIAITAVRVEKADYENSRVYISKIESFDHTPFFGVIDYDARLDKFPREEVKLPAWTAGWPEQIIIEDSAQHETIKELIQKLDWNYQRQKEAREEQWEREVEAEQNIFEKTNQKQHPTHIIVKGARENNLKGISVSIPYGKITAVVGVSGSGKSSLVMDTVYAECQRRMEYLSAEHSLRPRPEMDSMDGCIPVVMISQKEIRASSNSTIGTFCGINHHLRCIYSAIGKRNWKNEKQVQFKLTPATFRFLDPESRCQACNGKGRKCVPDITKIITLPEKSLLTGASPFLGKLQSYIDNPNANWMKGQVVALARDMDVDLSKPWNELPEDFKNKVLYGDETREITFTFDNKKRGRKGDITRTVEGIIPTINRLYIEDDRGGMSKKYMSEMCCDVCNGERLAAEGRLVTVLGMRFPVAAGLDFQAMRQFALRMQMELSTAELQLIEEHIAAIIAYCDTAKRLGIEYLELSRDVSMLSGGEAQRLKLLSAFQNHMTGILYIFDEPSKKLSAKEYCYIIDMMQELIAEGNTILMVEHNIDMIKIADYVIEIGPKAGKFGGYLVAEGTYRDVISYGESMLGQYEGKNNLHKRKKREKSENQTASFFDIEHVTANNLQDVSIQIPKSAMTCITGASGSGKSTLLYQGIMPQMEQSNIFDDVVLVESKISGGSSRSVVATYIGLMDEIRQLFASCEAAVEADLTDKDFSFNTGKLRCEHCGGDGRVKIPYTQDFYGVCPVCNGRRYSKLIKDIRWKEKDIADILNLSIEEALVLFKGEHEKIAAKCSLLVRVGLAYVKLGQSTSSLSGGEAARLKIASCLMNANVKNTLFLLDEPTCGLHFSDIDNLISLLYEIIDAGNTVVAIEHNKRFLAAADYTITMGPGAGEHGGKVISSE